jgi:hypothetical protein
MMRRDLLALAVAALPWAALPAAAGTIAPLVAGAAAVPVTPWREAVLPNAAVPRTRFSAVQVDGRGALRIESQAGYGNLVHPLALPAAGVRLRWSWRIEQFPAGADLRSKAGDDAGLKVCVFFDLPLAQVPFVERQLLRIARARSGEALPAATLCYLWDSALPSGTVLANAYTRRVRSIVLRSGAAGVWHGESRDVAADFAAVFGDESRDAPPISGIAVGADADNTGSRSLGFVADLELER